MSSEERTIKELEELFDTPFEEALDLANNHQNFEDLMNFLEGGIGAQFSTGNVEGMSDAELRRIVTELCKKHRRQEDGFHPTTGRLLLGECEGRGVELPEDVRDWLNYLVAREKVLIGNRLFDEQRRLKQELKKSVENSTAHEAEFKRMLYHLHGEKLEDLILAVAGHKWNRAMGNILLDEISRRGGTPEGCDKAVNRIIDDTATTTAAKT